MRRSRTWLVAAVGALAVCADAGSTGRPLEHNDYPERRPLAPMANALLVAANGPNYAGDKRPPVGSALDQKLPPPAAGKKPKVEEEDECD